MRKNVQVFKRILSVMLCLTLVASCLQQVSFVVYAEEVRTPVTRDVANQEEFIAALSDEDVEIIHLTNSVTLSRSMDGKDNVFVIPRAVTITGGDLALERAGIILGADVTFKDINIQFLSSVRNAIIANGHNLTLDTISTNKSTFDIDIFAGGISDYTGGNLNEIPSAGTKASVTIKGTNSFGANNDGKKGGNIFAGSLSDVGNQSADASNVFDGNVMITIEKDASGFGEIYAHGARENRTGGFANEWKNSAELYKVNGEVTVSLKESTPVTIHGETGGTKNAAFIYTDDGSGYLCTPTLEHVSSISLYPFESGGKTLLEPIIADSEQCSFEILSVPDNTRLSFLHMADIITVDKFYGGGELLFKEGAQLLTVTDEVSGKTKVAVGDVSFDNVNSMGTIDSEQTYIVVNKENEDYGFKLLPNSNNLNMVIINDGAGSWITRLAECSVVIRSIMMLSDIEVEADSNVDLRVPVEVVFAGEEDETQFLGDVPMIISINGTQVSREEAWMGYEYVAGEDERDLSMWFEVNEGLYITRVNQNAGFVAGRYKISIVIPAEYMENGKAYTLECILTVVCDEHSGGAANCSEKAKCEVCGESYGEFDSNNHTGGTELRGAKDATESEAGYTGDTYCLGCSTKIANGEEIPQLPKEETKISIERAIITLSSENYIYDGSKKEPEVTVVLENEILTRDDDYTVTYINNDVAGIASVIITGIGVYEGTQTKSFKIHTGGKATCTQKAVCEICDEPYGELDSGNHTGGEATCKEQAKCERCGVSYGKLDSNNHTGGTELRGAKDATESEAGYTGDTYCLGCSTKIANGEEIPKIPSTQKPEEELKKGDTFTLGKYKYLVTGKTTVAFNGIESTKTTKITIPESVTYKEFKFKVTSIADNALKGKSKVTSITISKNITSIGKNAFLDCKKLKTITVNTEKLTKVGSYALKGIASSAKIKVPTKKYSAYQKLFKNKGQGSKVKVVILAKKGDTFTSGNYKYKVTNSSTVEFSGLKSAKKTDVVISKTVTYGNVTFKVTSIAENALKGNTKVKKVTVGENVEKINKNAFYGCRNLKTIMIKSTKLKSIGKQAFKNIDAKATIKVPAKKYKAYLKLLKNKGQGNKVKIVGVK